MDSPAFLFGYQHTDAEMESRTYFQYESRPKISQRCTLAEIPGITGLGTDIVLPEEDIRPSQEAIWLKRGIYGFSHVGRMGLTSISLCFNNLSGLLWGLFSMLLGIVLQPWKIEDDIFHGCYPDIRIDGKFSVIYE